MRPFAPGSAASGRRRCTLGLLGVAAVTVALALALAVAAGSGSAAEPLTLTAGTGDSGWISLALGEATATPVVVRELIGDRRAFVTRIEPGTGDRRRHALRWRCERRVRRFVATAPDPGGGVRATTTTIRTPSCARRLQAIVAPARLRPGQVANVRVFDTWGFGGLSARVCATSRAEARRCQAVRLAAGRPRARARLRLPRSGRWSIVVRARSATSSKLGAPLRRTVTVRPGARLRVLVTGDSMIYKLFDLLALRLGERAAVRGDAKPGTGISKPRLLNWPAYARRAARDDDPDVTVVFLGISDYRALRGRSGTSISCCGEAWIDDYARRVRAMTTAYLRNSRGLVYWTLLPAPRHPGRAAASRAVNRAIRRAAASFADGVRLIDAAAVIAPGGSFAESIVYGGRLRRVRSDDGLHLAATGTSITASIIVRWLRSDGLVR
ncbi:MAG: uncharacterized protein QOC64_2601 [Solirubrobacteraceae bacterium]|jgi:hypothetical protein|nr:uncharacterized protein [Solirubrobacteraceae bacterium]